MEFTISIKKRLDGYYSVATGTTKKDERKVGPYKKRAMAVVPGFRLMDEITKEGHKVRVC